MNVTTKLGAIVLLGLGFTACQGFLEEEPRNSIALNQFFTLPEHAENAVNALYRDGAPALYMNGGVYSGRQAMFPSYMTGFFDNGYKGQEPYIQFAQQLSLSGTNVDGTVNDLWSQMYRTIGRANNAIKYIPETPGVSAENATRLLAEARFFRAWSYFTLVRLFGDVPLITEPYESLDDLYRTKSSVGEVYAAIVQDLRFAVDDGGLSDASLANNGYRLTRGAAATLLADVYLTMSGFPLQEDHYADAATAARSVINSGTYALAQNDPDGDLTNSAYNKMRRDEVTATEEIYPIEFVIGISGSEYPRYSYPVTLTGETAYDITNGAFQPRDEFLWGYDREEDLRRQNKQYWHNTFTRADGSEETFEWTPYIWHDDVALFESAASDKKASAYGYSELLLIAAEAIARSEGVTEEAVGYLTQVRARAYWKQDAADISAALSGLSVEDFVQEVWRERYRELVFDFKTWYDMVRTRTYPLTTDDGSGDIEFVPLVGQVNTWGQTFQEKHLLLPLPDRELQRNPELGQNPGY